MSLPRKLAIAGAVLAVVYALVATEMPVRAAGGLLYPLRRPVRRPAPENCAEETFAGAGVSLKGWRCRAATPRRGTVIYLHGVADNRASGVGMIQRFTQRGFDVIAYDSRAHGESGGEICTYGFFEKRDLSRVIDTVPSGPIFLIGSSLGAAVALQEAADDPRVSAVVAAESFSDLRTVCRERAPFFLSETMIRKAFAVAEERGRFKIDNVNVVAAASHIAAPVLLVHGAEDHDTPPDHSKRIFVALQGPKRLILVPAAHHNESMSGRPIWGEIERWLDGVQR
jgi:alpha-beta hydrolase superfamily lysophospholipase